MRGFFTNINDLDTQAMMQLMDQKTQMAAQALDEDYTAFDKVLSLPQPLLYNGTVPSCKRYHSPDNYRAYWFHPNHLGSSSYISNLSGAISQHMEYFPFGETLVEEHKNSNNSPYKFNGKELDEETGNYYYGARYYNPKWSFWLSVDPLAEEYPGWSPYNYVMNNPVKLVDPDGKAPVDWVDKNGHLIYDPSKNGGKGGYTKYATSTDKNLAKQLRRTSTGEKQFQKLVTSDTKVQVKYNTQDAPRTKKYNILGNTDKKGVSTASDLKGNVVEGFIKSAVITLYAKNIDESAKAVNDKYPYPSHQVHLA